MKKLVIFGLLAFNLVSCGCGQSATNILEVADDGVVLLNKSSEEFFEAIRNNKKEEAKQALLNIKKVSNSIVYLYDHLIEKHSKELSRDNILTLRALINALEEAEKTNEETFEMYNLVEQFEK